MRRVISNETRREASSESHCTCRNPFHKDQKSRRYHHQRKQHAYYIIRQQRESLHREGNTNATRSAKEHCQHLVLEHLVAGQLLACNKPPFLHATHHSFLLSRVASSNMGKRLSHRSAQSLGMVLHRQHRELVDRSKTPRRRASQVGTSVDQRTA